MLGYAPGYSWRDAVAVPVGAASGAANGGR
jgi:hypothetical protein